ncbi:MAG: hypothetical protein E7277_02195, partial [Lachnospiraceae bacterium]|nr:hypothetical protein [Lachnospiraceae bacterium]
MKATKKIWSGVLTVAMALSLVTPTGTVKAEAPAQVSFDNVGKGADMISMTNVRTFHADLALPEGTSKKKAQNLAKDANWTLYRSKGVMDAEKYPHQFKGGKLAKWKVFDSKKAFFSKMETKAVKTKSGYKLRLTLKNRYLFGVNGIDLRPRKYRSAMLDYVGTYTLTCKDKNGNVLG